MATIERFEDIDAWKAARVLTAEVYRVTASGDFARDFGLKDQIRRASISIMLNIAEGFDREGNNELRQFLAVAKGSVGEVRAALYIALDARFIDEEQFETIRKMTDDTGRLIGGFMRYLSTSSYRGRKYRSDEKSPP